MKNVGAPCPALVAGAGDDSAASRQSTAATVLVLAWDARSGLHRRAAVVRGSTAAR
jgi:hypothetical protein